MKRMISTRVHGMLDYLVSLFLIAMPWLLDFDKSGAETWVPVGLGVAAIVYSLLTNYELGLFRTISMRTHLGLDLANGIVLAASPWLFGFADHLWAPHLILGMLEIGVVLGTKRYSSTEERHSRRSSAA